VIMITVNEEVFFCLHLSLRAQWTQSQLSRLPSLSLSLSPNYKLQQKQT